MSLDTTRAFRDFRTGLFSIVNNGKESPETEALFSDFVDSVRQTGVLPEGFSDKTDEFMEDMSPKIIRMMLSSDNSTDAVLDLFQALLCGYITLLPFVIGSKFDGFLSSATLIFAKENKMYKTKSSWSLMEPESVHLKRNITLLSQSDVIARIYDFLEVAEEPSFLKFSVFLRLLQTGAFDAKIARKCRRMIVDKLVSKCEALDGAKIREIDEKNMEPAFKLAMRVSSHNSKLDDSLWNAWVGVNARMAVSPYLAKRFEGLRAIQKLMVDRANIRELCNILNEQNLIGSVLDDLHEQLVMTFASIMNTMTSCGLVKKGDANKFWMVVFRQPVSTIDLYLSAGDVFLRDLKSPGLVTLFEAACQERWFTPAVLEYLKVKGRLFDDEDIKCKLFGSLQEFYMSGACPEASRPLLIRTMCEFTSMDAAVRRNMALEILSIGKNVDLGIALFIRDRDRISDTYARAFWKPILDVVKKRDSETAELIMALKCVFFALEKLDESDFTELLDSIMPHLNASETKLCSFLTEVVRKDGFSDAMLLNLLRAICTIDIMEIPVTSLVEEIVKHESLWDGAIECLWKYVSEKHVPAIMDIVINAYISKGLTSSLVQKAISDLNGGSATILVRLIRKVEYEIYKGKYNIESNCFIPDIDKLSVKVTGIIQNEIRVPVSLRMPDLIGWISDITEKPKSCLSTGGKSLYDGVAVNIVSSGFGLYTPPDIKALPTQLLVKDIDKLMNAIDDDAIGSIVLKVLNEMTPRDGDLAMVLGEPNWPEFFSIQHYRRFVYRINLIGSLLQRDPGRLQPFVNSGGFAFLLRVLFKDGCDMPDMRLIVCLVSEIIANKVTREDVMRVLAEIDPELFDNFVSTLVERISDNLLITVALGVFEAVISANHNIIEKLTNVTGLLVGCTTSNLRVVRSTISNIVSNNRPEMFQSSIVPLLEGAIGSDALDAFDVIQATINASDDLLDVWNHVVDFITRRVTAGRPSESFVRKVFEITELLLKKVKGPLSNASEFCRFIIDEIIFNFTWYFGVSSPILSLVQKLANGDEQLREHLQGKVSTAWKEFHGLDHRKSSIQFTRGDKYKGLMNMGATCYLSAIIQQLFFIPQLRNALLSETFTDEWAIELQYLFTKMAIAPGTYVDPEQLVRKWTMSDGVLLNPREQQDASEFLSLFVDRLEKVLPGIVESMFKGEIHRTLTGTVTEYLEESTEEVCNVLVETVERDNLMQSIREILPRDREISYSPKENTEIQVLRNCRMKLPPIFIITLKRFKYNLADGKKTKNNEYFSFPESLNLACLTKTGADPVNYELTGIVEHMGDGTSGHYISHARVDDGSWWTFNDQSARQTSSAVIQSNFGGQVGGSAYVLLYKSTDPDLLPPVSEMIVSDQMKQRLVEEVRICILTRLHENREYVRFATMFVTDGDALLDVLLSGSPHVMTQVIERARDPEFATRVLGNDRRHNDAFVGHANSVNVANYCEVLSVCVSTAAPDAVLLFADRMITQIMDISEQFASCKELSTDIFKPLIACVKVAQIDVATWATVAGQALAEVLKNPRVLTFDLSFLYELLYLLIQLDSSIAKDVSRILPELVATKNMSNPSAPQRLMTLVFRLFELHAYGRSFMKSLINNGSPEAGARCFETAISTSKEYVIEFVNAVAGTPTSRITAIMAEICRFDNHYSGEELWRFGENVQLWISTFIIHTDCKVRHSAANVMYSLCSPSEGSDTDVAVMQQIVNALLELMITLPQRIVRIIEELSKGRRLDPSTVSDMLPTQTFFPAMRWAVTNEIFVDDVMLRAGSFSGCCKVFTKIAKDMNITTPLTDMMQCILRVINPWNSAQFFRSADLSLFLDAMHLLFTGKVRYANDALPAFISIIPPEFSKVVFASKFSQILYASCAEQPALSDVCADNLKRMLAENADQNACVRIFDAGVSRRARLEKCIPYIRLVGHIMSMNPATVDSFDKSLVSPLWTLASADINQDTPNASELALSCLKTLSIYNKTYARVNKGKMDWHNRLYVEKVSESWSVSVDFRKLMSFAVRNVAAKADASGCWDFIGSLTSIGAKWTARVREQFKTKPLLLKETPDSSKLSCVNTMHRILRYATPDVNEACDMVLRQFHGLASSETVDGATAAAIWDLLAEFVDSERLRSEMILNDVKQVLGRIDGIRGYSESTADVLKRMPSLKKDEVELWINLATKYIDSSLHDRSRATLEVAETASAVSFVTIISDHFGLSGSPLVMNTPDLRELSKHYHEAGDPSASRIADFIDYHLFLRD